MKKTILLIMCLILTICFSSCTGGPQSNNKTKIPDSVILQETDVLKGKKIGCTIVYKGDEWASTVSDALEIMATKYGAELSCEDGDLNDETQTKQIENMIANGCDLLLVDPVTLDGCNEALMKAVEKNIPIIIFDGIWTYADQYAVTSVSWDQYETGVVTANYLIDRMRQNGEKEARVIELTNAISTHCQDRFVGFHDTIKKATDLDIKVLYKYDAQGNRETAYNIISSIVDPYDYVVSDIDNESNGAVAALKAAGNTKVKVLSMGGYGAEPFEAVHSNDVNYLAFLDVDSWQFAELVMDSVIAYFSGEEQEKTIYLEPVMIDSKNAEKYWNFDK